MSTREQRNLRLTSEANAVLDDLPERERGAYVSAAILAHDPSGPELVGEAAAWLTASGRGSGYLDAVLRQRGEAAMAALEMLAATGWTDDEIRIACALADGAPPPGQPLGAWLAIAMVEDERIAREQQARLGLPEIGGYAGQAGVTTDRWHELARRVREDEPTARAAYAVALEWWADHGEVCRRLGDG